jgi:hypothetical protein
MTWTHFFQRLVVSMSDGCPRKLYLGTDPTYMYKQRERCHQDGAGQMLALSLEPCRVDGMPY